MRNLVRFTRLIVLTLLLAAGVLGRAQTCSQCQNTAASASPQAQRAARHAILALLFPALGITGVIALVAYRSRNSFAHGGSPAADVANQKPL